MQKIVKDKKVSTLQPIAIDQHIFFKFNFLISGKYLVKSLFFGPQPCPNRPLPEKKFGTYFFYPIECKKCKHMVSIDTFWI